MTDEHQPDHVEARRNFQLTVWNGILSVGAFALFDATLVVAAFIVQTGGSDILVGLAGTVAPLGFSWPQLFVANMIQARPRKLFVYQWGALFRIGTLLVLAGLMWVYRGGVPAWFPYVLVGLLFAHWSFTGITAVPWFEVVSKIIAPRDRPVVFAWRHSGGQLLALGGGFVVTWALSRQSGLEFPVNYMFLLLLMTLLLAVALAMFAIVREPYDPESVGERRPWGEYFRVGPRILRRDGNYRRLLIGNLGFATSLAATPFLVPFLIRRIGMDASVVGPLMVVTSLVTVLMTIYYGWLGRTKGNRAVVVLAGRLGAFSPALALCAGLAPEIRLAGFDVRFLLIVVALVFSRVAMFAMSVGRNNYLLDIAPPAERPTYVGFWMTAALVTTVLPMLAGVVADTLGYLPVFAACVAGGAVALVTFNRLAEPRVTQQA